MATPSEEKIPTKKQKTEEQQPANGNGNTTEKQSSEKNKITLTKKQYKRLKRDADNWRKFQEKYKNSDDVFVCPCGDVILESDEERYLVCNLCEKPACWDDHLEKKYCGYIVRFEGEKFESSCETGTDFPFFCNGCIEKTKCTRETFRRDTEPAFLNWIYVVPDSKGVDFFDKLEELREEHGIEVRELEEE